MKPRSRRSATLRLLLAPTLAAGALLGQETPPPGQTFIERVAIDIVNVDVYVTDAEGRPVTTLGRDDFEILEDGQPVELVNFYRVAGGQAQSEHEVAETPASEAEARPAGLAPAGDVPESQRLHLIVYVDNFHIHPLNRNRLFRDLRAFLRTTVRGGDEVMVASYDRSLNIRHPFTRDTRLVSRVLRQLEEVSGSGKERELERAAAIQQIYESTSLREALRHAKEFADAGEFELGRALEALDELIDSLAGLPGRKMLLHVSDGLPMIPGQDLYQAIQQRFADIAVLGEAASRDMSRRFMQIINNANSNRVSFYTIDAAGLRVQSRMGAENRAVSSPFVVSTAVDATMRSNLMGPLRLMARRTGGQAIVNTNDFGAGLARFGRDFENYYSLGYRAPVSNRGRYHRIEVRLKQKRPGWSLRHREGYRDKTIEERVADSVEAFLVHGYEQNPLGVTYDFGKQVPADDGLVNVPIRIRVPMERLTLLPQQGVYVARLRLYFGALDERGRDAELQELPFELRIPEASLEIARKDEVARVIQATMREGDQRLVIAVRDEISEERSVIGGFVRVGARADAP